MKAGNVRGSHGSIMVTECADCSDCEAAEELAADTENNPETLNEDHHHIIGVVGGVGPFDWTISGDASLAKVRTVGRQNSIHVYNNGCGGVNLTVTDACDTVLDMAFRIAENGKWMACARWGPIDGITCYTCRCGPCFRQSSYALDANRQLAASCAAIGCDGPEDCAQWKVCPLPAITCQDYYHHDIYYSFPCFDPCGNGGGYTIIGPGNVSWVYWTCNT